MANQGDSSQKEARNASSHSWRREDVALPTGSANMNRLIVFNRRCFDGGDRRPADSLYDFLAWFGRHGRLTPTRTERPVGRERLTVLFSESAYTFYFRTPRLSRTLRRHGTGSSKHLVTRTN